MKLEVPITPTLEELPMERPRRLTERPRTEMVRVDGIDTSARHHRPDAAAVERLASSMREIGLRTPITVRYYPDRPGVDDTVDSYVLVAGGHRLAAAKLLGWEEIECFEADANDDDAELWEIDENLCRSELSAAEEVAAITVRKEIYERLHPEVKHGAPTVSRQIGDTRKRTQANRFTLDTAEKTGKPERTIQRLVKRGKEIGAVDLARITRTSLDREGELDALVSMPTEQRGPLIERAAAGEDVTARVRHIRRPRRRGWRGHSPERIQRDIWVRLDDALENLTGMPLPSEVAAIIRSRDKSNLFEARLKKVTKYLENLDHEYRQLRNQTAAAA